MNPVIRRRIFTLAVPAILCACAGPKALEVPPTQIFSLGEQSPAGATGVRIDDQRMPMQREREAIAGGIRLGDGSLSPSPIAALRSALEAFARAPDTPPKAKQLLTGNVVRLKRFDVTIVEKNLTETVSQSPQPGIAATDSVMRNLAQSIAGGSDVTVHIEIEVGGANYESYGTGVYTASPGAWATRRPFNRAIESLTFQLGRAW